MKQNYGSCVYLFGAVLNKFGQAKVFDLFQFWPAGKIAALPVVVIVRQHNLGPYKQDLTFGEHKKKWLNQMIKCFLVASMRYPFRKKTRQL